MNKYSTVVVCSPIAICFMFTLLFIGCKEGLIFGDKRSLARIMESGSLIVATSNGPTTRYINNSGEPEGFEHDLVTAFAEHLGIEVEFKSFDTIEEILAAVQKREVDLAAAGLTKTAQRMKSVLFGPSYQVVSQVLVCHRSIAPRVNLDQLEKYRLLVQASTSYVETLNTLKMEYPQLQWQESSEFNTEQILYKVWSEEVECTVADQHLASIYNRYLPELKSVQSLTANSELAWALHPQLDDVQAAVEQWFRLYKDEGEAAKLIEKYYGFFKRFDYVNVKKFMKRIKTRLPKLQPYFEQAAEKYNLPYELLVAQAYQESHWKANAVSPTGVRGIMMLTQTTAKAMGVTNRRDAKQSIMGGAKYLSNLINDRFDEAVKEPDRTWLALAAYNVGRGHIHDAQRLARSQGLDPFAWKDIKRVLPLLADKRYYPKLKYGYARGWEPVQYVEAIREYLHILNTYEKINSIQSHPSEASHPTEPAPER